MEANVWADLAAGPASAGTSFHIQRFRTPAFRAVGYSSDAPLALAPAELLGLLLNLEATLQRCLELVASDGDDVGTDSERREQLRRLASIVRALDLMAPQVLSTWLRVELPNRLHQGVLVKHGQWFRRSPDECATWVERLETPFSISGPVYAVACGLLAAGTIHVAGKLQSMMGAGRDSAAGNCQAKPGRAVLGVVGAAAAGVAVAACGTLPRTASEAAVAATEMDEALEQLTRHMLQQYRGLVRDPLCLAADILLQGDLMAMGSAVQPGGPVVPPLQQAAAGVTQLRRHVNAIWQPQAADELLN